MRLGDSQDALAHATAVPAAGDPGHTGHRVRSLDLQSGKISTLCGSFCVFLRKQLLFCVAVFIYICIYTHIYILRTYLRFCCRVHCVVSIFVSVLLNV